MNLVLTSDFPATPNEAVMKAMTRAAANPRIAWLPLSAESLRTHFETAQRSFAALGLVRLEPIDVGKQPGATQLALIDECDVLYVTGGDPILFRDALVRFGVREGLKQRVQRGGCVVAASGGAMQFTPNLSLFRLLGTPVSRVISERDEFAAIGAVGFELLPHLNRQSADLLDAAERYAEHVPAQVIALSDGAAVLVSDDGVSIIGAARRLPAAAFRA